MYKYTTYSMPKTQKRTNKGVPPAKVKTTTGDEVCGICLENTSTDTVSQIACSHRYCHDCILQWSKYNNTCPMCKKEFRHITVVSTNSREEVQRPRSRVARRDMDNSHGFYSFIISAFFRSTLFRSRLELGLLNGQRAPLAIYLILLDILEQMQEHGITPQVFSQEEYDSAYEWLGRMDTIIGSLRLHTIQFIT